MQEDLKSDIIIRDMQESDVSWIILSAKDQGKSLDVEKFYSRLEEQSKGKNFALIAEYKGEIAGYIYVYPFSKTGLFKNYDYTEIVGLTIFNKFQDFRIDDKLLDAAEKIASDYSDIVYLSLKINDWKTLNRCVKRDFIIHKSGVWQKNSTGHDDLDLKNEDQLEFWLFKNLDKAHTHRFLISNKVDRPYLRWFQEGKQKVFGSINIDKCHKIKVGDEIQLVSKQNDAYVKGIVIFKHKYDTLCEMLKSEGVKNLLPFLNDDDVEKGVQVYQDTPEYHCVNEYGCVAFGLKIVESKL